MIINKKDLLAALNAVNIVVPKKSILPILKCVVIEAKDGKATIRGMDMQIDFLVEVDCTGDLSVCVPCSRLKSVVGLLPDGPVELIDDGKFHVKCERIDVTMFKEDVAEFPMAVDGEELEHVATMTCVDMKAALKAVAHAIGRGETRMSLIHTLFELGDSPLAIATDGFRLAIRKTSANVVTESKLLIPWWTAEKLLRWLPTTGDVRVSLNRILVMLEFGRMRVQFAMFDGKYPNWRVILQATNRNACLTVSKAGLLRAARLAQLDYPSAMRMETRGYIFNVSSGSSVQVGIPFDTGDQTDFVIAANPDYVCDAMLAMDDDAIAFDFYSETRAFVLRSLDGKHTEVIMPMNLP